LNVSLDRTIARRGKAENVDAGRIIVLGCDCSDLPDRDRTGVRLATAGGAVVATHNLELARHMDRVFALKDGHLEEQAKA
jgi:hypothetical protein